MQDEEELLAEFCWGTKAVYVLQGGCVLLKLMNETADYCVEGLLLEELVNAQLQFLEAGV